MKRTEWSCTCSRTLSYIEMKKKKKTELKSVHYRYAINASNSKLLLQSIAWRKKICSWRSGFDAKSYKIYILLWCWYAAGCRKKMVKTIKMLSPLFNLNQHFIGTVIQFVVNFLWMENIDMNTIVSTYKNCWGWTR